MPSGGTEHACLCYWSVGIRRLGRGCRTRGRRALGARSRAVRRGRRVGCGGGCRRPSRVAGGPRQPHARRRRRRCGDPHGIQSRLLALRAELRTRPSRDRDDRRGTRGLGPAAGRHVGPRACRARTCGDGRRSARAGVVGLSACVGSGRGRAGGARRARIGRASAAVRARRRRSRLRAAPDRVREGEGSVGLRRRWRQPLACRAPARCGARVPARGRTRRGRRALSRGRRYGRAVPRHRGGDRPAARRAGRRENGGRSRRALRLVRDVRGDGCAGNERAHARIARLGTDAAGAAGRYRPPARHPSGRDDDLPGLRAGFPVSMRVHDVVEREREREREHEHERAIDQRLQRARPLAGSRVIRPDAGPGAASARAPTRSDGCASRG